jgi:D-aminopeptidase
LARPRARDFGIEFSSMKPGRLNAITDVEGVGVGHSTLIEGSSIRTGVTAIVPHPGNLFDNKVVAAVDFFNAYGKSTGLPQIMYEGTLESPLMLTETMNTWRVADAVVDYQFERMGQQPQSINIVVGETNGDYLTDNLDRRVGKEQVFGALDIARSPKGRSKVIEGNVGGGTPMTGYGFKGGIGTASRVNEGFTVGVLVQLNCGSKDDLTIAGIPVGREVKLPEIPPESQGNSIMMIVATDLAAESRQIWKVAKRATLGLARTGTYGSNNSGDFTIAFTTGMKSYEGSSDQFLNPVYKATVEATEEAVINALFAAETMTGHKGNVRHALPLNQVRDIIERHGRPLS